MNCHFITWGFATNNGSWGFTTHLWITRLFLPHWWFEWCQVWYPMYFSLSSSIFVPSFFLFSVLLRLSLNLVLTKHIYVNMHTRIFFWRSGKRTKHNWSHVCSTCWHEEDLVLIESSLNMAISTWNGYVTRSNSTNEYGKLHPSSLLGSFDLHWPLSNKKTTRIIPISACGTNSWKTFFFSKVLKLVREMQTYACHWIMPW